MLQDTPGCCRGLHEQIVHLKARTPECNTPKLKDGDLTILRHSPANAMQVHDILQLVRTEATKSEARHADLLRKMQAQHQALQLQIAEIVTAKAFAETYNDLSTCMTSLPASQTRLSDLFQKSAPGGESCPRAPVSSTNDMTPAVQDRQDTRPESLEEVSEGEEPSPEVEPASPAAPSTLSKSASKLSTTSKLKLGKGNAEPEDTFLEKAKNAMQARSWPAFKDLLMFTVTHDKFEGSIAALIMANALVLCFEVQYNGLQIGYDLKYSGCDNEASEAWPLASGVFAFFDWVFGFLFLSEAIVKLICFSYKYFCDRWNWLDFSCVLAFFLEKIGGKLIDFDAKALRLLRLLRLMRLVRLLRALESLDHLYIMTTAIRGMFMVLLWAIMLLSVMLMTAALFLTQILHAYYFKDASTITSTSADLATQRELYKYFGSFTRCFLSMFELTLANWPPVARLLIEEVSEWFMPLCLLHKLTIGFAVVGVITGVILQETFKVASTDDWVMVRQKTKASAMLKKKMYTLFEALDQEGDGSVSQEEFEIIGNQPDVKMWLASMDVETDDLEALFKLIDDDGNGSVTVDELARRMPRIKGFARSIDLLSMKNLLVPQLLGHPP
jgi:Ca2+-binding EF-hand superfamily protein